MADDQNIVSKSAVLQSVTAEANGFYGAVVTVASTFLGGSLLFLEKFAPAESNWSIYIIGFGWIALAAAIGCIARVRFMKSAIGKAFLEDRHDDASKIDKQTALLSNLAQWLLIGGMVALVVVGIVNFKQFTKAEKVEPVSNQNDQSRPLRESIPYGSLKQSTPAPAQPVPTQSAPVVPPQPAATDKK